MSDVLSEISEGGDQLAGLTKLMSAKKKADTKRSTKGGTSVISTSVGSSRRGTVLVENEEYNLLEAKYKGACASLGISPQRSLAQMLRGVTTIADFSGFVLGPVGSKPLFEALRGDGEIATLRLANCGLTDESMVLLVEVAFTMPRLRNIDVEGNCDIGFVGGIALERLCSRRSFETVGIDGTSIREGCRRAIGHLASTKAPSQL